MPALSGVMRDLLGARQPLAPVDAGRPLAAYAAPLPAPGNKRVKLWDLQPKHHCPVIGTCLRAEELARFARRYRFEADWHDEFAMHVEAVGWCQNRNEVSEALQKQLDRKYDAWVTRFSKLKTDVDVLAAWKAYLAQGDVAGPLWAAYTHKAAGANTRHTVYADIHMLSHQIGAGQAADARRLAYLEKENADLKRSLDAESKQHMAQSARFQGRLSELEATVRDHAILSEELARLRIRLGQIESGDAITEMGRRLMSLQRASEHTAAAHQRIAELEKSLQAAQQDAADAAQQRDAAVAGRDALESLLLTDRQMESGCGTQCTCCEHAPSHRCVLYVGGRASLVAHYRLLAERMGIRLIHHDGGQEEALSRLPELIHGADAVICPTDCVSHSAYYNLKNHCKRTGKPCLFFKGAGIASFADAMARLSRGEVSLAGQMEEPGL